VNRIQPPFITEEMSKLQVHCKTCGRRVKPDFWTRHKDPFVPVRSTHSPDVFWHQIGVQLNCECGEKLQLLVPWRELKHSISHFGDEAYRDVGRNFIAVYTLLGISTGYEKDIGLALEDEKKSTAPMLDPNSWRIHVTEMNNGRKRIQHPQYKHLSRDDVEFLLVRCANIIEKMDDYAWKSCIVCVYQLGNHPKRDRRAIRSAIERGMLLGLLGDAIYQTTAQELLPQFFFDAQSIKALTAGTEGWAEEAYLGSRHYLGHLFVSHSNDIPPPRFVRPGSHPLLELADVHAYSVARFIERKIRRLPLENDLERFGKFKYLSFRGSSINWSVANSVPENFIWP
jgi:hypothetical protein